MTIIRFFATTDDSYVGRCARGYVKALLAMAPVRLVSVNGPFVVEDGNPWSPFAPLFATPLADSFVNVVCCDAYRWAWDQQCSMPNVAPDGRITSFSKTSTAVELYTEGVRNVLMVASAPPTSNSTLGRVRTTMQRYEALVSPTARIASQWHLYDCHPQVFPVPVTDIAALRAVVMP